ncbi:phosphatase PAP2 family protein [candidate division WOR-3 bacterium]|nr:phosphatase PAP2 family protein [candidate division WOR-3 bacterium]
MEYTTKLGDGRTVLLTSTVMSFGDEKMRRCGELSMASFAVSGILTVGIKYAVNRQRPNGGTSSFPSGHTSTAFSWAAVVSSEYPQYSIPVFAVAGLVGVSRIALDKHWTSDVIAGAVIGYFSGLFIEKISCWITDY